MLSSDTQTIFIEFLVDQIVSRGYQDEEKEEKDGKK